MSRETRSLALFLLAVAGTLAPWLVVIRHVAEMLR